MTGQEYMSITDINKFSITVDIVIKKKAIQFCE